jgi:predicted nucleotidyltransferase
MTEEIIMLTGNQIAEEICKIAVDYEIRSVAYFGSYANGNMTEDSDLDVLVEFVDEFHSLYIEIEFQQRLEAALKIPVDVATIPRPKESTLIIDNKVIVYEANRQNSIGKDKRRSVFSERILKTA